MVRIASLKEAFSEPVGQIVDNLGFLEGAQFTVAAVRWDEAGGRRRLVMARMGPMSPIGSICGIHKAFR